MLRLLSTATVLSLGTIAFLVLAVPRLYTGIDEHAIRAELQAWTEGDVLDQRARAALEQDDVDGARQYKSLADELGKPLAPETEQALEEAQSTLATVMRNASAFAGAYVTGKADSTAGLAGAIVSDLTVVGDVRDIISEGGKAAIGEDYSQFLLALAAVGLAAEGATIATGGSSLPFKAAVSVMKVAKRTGNLTAAFSGRILRLARAASGQARGIEVASAGRLASDVPLTSMPVAATAGGTALTRAAARAELRTTAGAINTMASNAGAANAVRMMRFVRTTRDAKELATFTGRFGRRARAVIEVTGKTALRGFRAALRGLRLLVAFLWSLVAWVAGLAALRFVKLTIRAVFSVLRGTFGALVPT